MFEARQLLWSLIYVVSGLNWRLNHCIRRLVLSLHQLKGFRCGTLCEWVHSFSCLRNTSKHDEPVEWSLWTLLDSAVARPALVFPWLDGLLADSGLLIVEASRSHSDTPHSVGLPMDEWSARRREFYLLARNTHKRQTSVPPGRIRTHIPSKWVTTDPRLGPLGHQHRRVRR